MRKIVWIVLITLAAVYTTYALVTLDRRSDEAQIAALVASGTKAVGERDLSTAMSCISKKYKDKSGMNYERLRAVIAQTLQAENDYTVNTTTQNVELNGDKVIVEVHVDVKSKNDGSSMYDRNLTINMHKESARHALILPVKVWRVTSFTNLGLNALGGGLLDL